MKVVVSNRTSITETSLNVTSCVTTLMVLGSVDISSTTMRVSSAVLKGREEALFSCHELSHRSLVHRGPKRLTAKDIPRMTGFKAFGTTWVAESVMSVSKFGKIGGGGVAVVVS
jgi:hypothetical protein